MGQKYGNDEITFWLKRKDLTVIDYYISCVADNSLGRSKKYMEVSGRPGPAEFHSAPWSKSPDSYNLTWKVDSYPPLQEVRLLYRKLMVSWIKSQTTGSVL